METVAASRGIDYSDLVGLITAASYSPQSPRLARLLTDISHQAPAEGRGMLAAVVVRKDARRPGRASSERLGSSVTREKGEDVAGRRSEPAARHQASPVVPARPRCLPGVGEAGPTPWYRGGTGYSVLCPQSVVRWVPGDDGNGSRHPSTLAVCGQNRAPRLLEKGRLEMGSLHSGSAPYRGRYQVAAFAAKRC